jgi:hypothetical protein
MNFHAVLELLILDKFILDIRNNVAQQRFIEGGKQFKSVTNQKSSIFKSFQ